MTKTIHMAADHAGFDLKQALLPKLKENFVVQDYGPFNKVAVDYPDYANLVGQKLNSFYLQNESYDSLTEFGLLICGSGQGMNIAANKFDKLRSALCYNEEIAKMARAHNNAQVICLGARFTTLDEAYKMILVFAQTSFDGGRHQNRVLKIGQCR
jgi:ribose 5-phosphate isomerase B